LTAVEDRLPTLPRMPTLEGQGWRGNGQSARRPVWTGFKTGGTGYRKKKNDSGIDISKHPLGTLLTTLSYLEVAETKCTDNANITDCEFVASYNWLTMPARTILVPGKF
jgi:hypothetical protein